MNYRDLSLGGIAWLLALIILFFSVGYKFIAPFMTSPQTPPPPDILLDYPAKWQQTVESKDCRETDLSTEERAKLYLKWSFLNQKPTIETNKMIVPNTTAVPPAVSDVQTEPVVEEPIEQPTKQHQHAQKPKSSESRHHGHSRHRIWYTKHGHRFYHY
jgi:hypothetical protein